MQLTKEQKIALGERAIACKNWDWTPGMRWFNKLDDSWGRIMEGSIRLDFVNVLPDFSDPATVGCLQYLVRKKYDQWDIVPFSLGLNVWRIGNYRSWQTFLFKAESEAEALLHALEK